tara:strand:+ start:22677 stop:23609 length:933 start_codon:yes stop_codon:yes gene_type:complete
MAKLKFKKKNLLILGGSGFIAQNLIQKLISKKYKIIVITFKKISLKTKYSNIKLIQHNFKKSFDYKSFKFPRNICVINLYGSIESKDYYNGGQKYINENFIAITNICNLLNNLNISKLIHVGSSDEYGLETKINSQIQNGYPFNTYSFAKILNSNFLFMHFHQAKIQLIILKLFLVYGPRQKNNRLIPSLIESFINKKNFQSTKGNQVRDFCYIDDVNDAIINCIELNKRYQFPLIMDIGSGKGIKIKTVINKIRNNFKDSKIKINTNLKKIQRNNLVADISKAKKILKWSPKVNFEKGLEKTINYFKNK